MTVRERVLISRLIDKIENQKSYATKIGISYTSGITNASVPTKGTFKAGTKE